MEILRLHIEDEYVREQWSEFLRDIGDGLDTKVAGGRVFAFTARINPC
jgi:hypothetical protein